MRRLPPAAGLTEIVVTAQRRSENIQDVPIDLERVEVLEGPQGTLYGAGAQAGVIRYITNKPKLNLTQANFTAGYGVTAGGDPNTDLTAVLNLPMIANTLAVRAVIYNDRRGGYINNVPATSLGVSRDAWSAEFFAQNLTNVIKSTFNLDQPVRAGGKYHPSVRARGQDRL
jgi:outer membrane receptor protein involved in Fe transport